MNPDKTIKPWLLAAGKQFGIKEAHGYRWPDADTRQEEMYCTYKIVGYDEQEDGNINLTTKTAHTAHRTYEKLYDVIVQVDLFDSQDGMHELASMCVSTANPNIYNIFGAQACSFIRSTAITNLTDDENQERLDYHHRLICMFEEKVQHTLDEENAVVDTINITVFPEE